MVRRSHKQLLLGKTNELCDRKDLDEFLRSIEFNSGVVVAFDGEEGGFGECIGSMKITYRSSRFGKFPAEVSELSSGICGGDGGCESC